MEKAPEPKSVQMTVNSYKCWAKLCYIIDKVLRVKLKLLQSHWCFPQLIKAAKSYTVSWDRRGLGIADNTSILSSFGYSEVVGFQALQCCFTPACAPPTPGVLTSCLTSTSTSYFISSPHLLLFFTWWRIPALSPELWHFFKLYQKVSFLENKQIRNLFSAQHILSASSLHTLLASSSAVLVLMCQMFLPILNFLQ